MQIPTSLICNTLYVYAAGCRNLHSVHSVQLNSVLRRYVMAESSQNMGALWASRYEFHYHLIVWVSYVPVT